ncbi:MAG TPA: pyridoxamine 5'-phosphate oxidase family protein [Patescibacteria group bacterium]|nr:pyridoxamine 5'-phosphate oxidase family protein [Patescibacteria group bacterium]
MDLKALISDYLTTAKIMQIATAKENQPWACTVYFAADNNLNIFWLSTPQRRHSEEIESNEKVAGAIVVDHAPGDKVHGIQFEGTAKRLTNQEEIDHAVDTYAKKMGTDAKRVEELKSGKDSHAVYMITPKKIVLFDVIHFPDNPRQEYVL